MPAALQEELPHVGDAKSARRERLTECTLVELYEVATAHAWRLLEELGKSAAHECDGGCGRRRRRTPLRPRGEAGLRQR